MNYSPAEVKVREATNPDEAWGPHGSIMAEIAKVSWLCAIVTVIHSTNDGPCLNCPFGSQYTLIIYVTTLY
jgi:hypothetical protein